MDIITTLSSLIYQLNKKGYIRAVEDVTDILGDLVDNEELKSFLANLCGLRGDVKPEFPIGGFGPEPFFAEKETI
jgi:hypothetical protein